VIAGEDDNGVFCDAAAAELLDEASDAVVESSVMMGADYYETDEDREENARLGRPDMGIGEGSIIECAIVDKKARIGRGVHIRHVPERPDEEHEDWVAKDGLVIVSKSAVIPDGTVI